MADFPVSTPEGFSSGYLRNDLEHVSDFSLSNQLWPAANVAFFFYLYVPRKTTTTKMFVRNGSVVSGNFDLGIYDWSLKTKLGSTGSTAQSGTNTTQYVSLAVTLKPGSYWLAMSADNTTARYNGSSAVGNGDKHASRAFGTLQMASAFPLPSNAITSGPPVGRDTTYAFIPWVGVY